MQGSKYIETDADESPTPPTPSDGKLEKGASASLPGDSAHNGSEALRH
jgi:hypothetical protein